MRPLLSTAQMRSFEGELIAAGVDPLLLMENAGRGAAHLIGLRVKPKLVEGRATATRGSCVRCADEAALATLNAVVLCGVGNNGGDGYVVARHLLLRGANVTVLRLGPAASESARKMALAYAALGGLSVDYTVDVARALLSEADVIVDALFGVGLTRPLEGEALELVGTANGSARPIIALDVPSGLDADTGAVRGDAILAEHTVTFGFLKLGLLTTFGHRHGGRITLSHIGVPATLGPAILPGARLFEEDALRRLQRPREATAHKGKSGRVLLIGGSPGMEGAARLAARAAYRGGAGLVTIGCSKDSYRELRTESVDVLTLNLNEETRREELFRSFGVSVVGPGLMPNEEAAGWLEQVLAAETAVVIDAGGLRLLAERPRRLREDVVLTPHPAEAAALLGCSTDEIENDRFSSALRLVERYGATVVLKGSRPIVAAPGAAPVVTALGSASLAVAGSGDVLSGLVAAELAHRLDRTVLEATLVGVGEHALAGALFEQRHGPEGLLASEIADLVVEVRASLG